MFWSKNKKKVYPCKPQFYYIKVRCKGLYITRTCYHDDFALRQCTRKFYPPKGGCIRNYRPHQGVVQRATPYAITGHSKESYNFEYTSNGMPPMFWSKNKKKVYICKPQFYYIKVRRKGYTLHGHVIMMILHCVNARESFIPQRAAAYTITGHTKESYKGRLHTQLQATPRSRTTLSIHRMACDREI